MEDYTDVHRYFVQFMLTHGAVTQDQALKFVTGIDPSPNLNMLIIQINRKVNQQDFKIVNSTCEVTNRAMVMLVNSKNDDLSRLQNQFSKVELEYFHAIMEEILDDQQYTITYPVCLNITSSLNGVISRTSGEEVFTKWLKGMYFIKNGGNIFLGPRLIEEFAPYLRSHYEECICALCSELNFIGDMCSSCSKKYHNLCITKYLDTQDSCPNCNVSWDHTQHPSPTDMDESD